MPFSPHLRVSFWSSFTKNLEILAGGGALLFRGGKVESQPCRLTGFLSVCWGLNGYLEAYPSGVQMGNPG